MDNDEIKQMFTELKVHVSKNIEAGQKEHKEIREWLQKLCDRMTSTESTLDNHLTNTEKKAKTQKEKTQYLITGVSLGIAAIAVISNTFF